MNIVALEEHYATDDVVAAWQALDAPIADNPCHPVGGRGLDLIEPFGGLGQMFRE